MLKRFIPYLWVLLLGGCGLALQGNTTTGGSGGTVITTESVPNVNFGNVAAIQLANGASAQTNAIITNNTDAALILESTSISALVPQQSGTIDPNIYYDASQCKAGSGLAAGGSCAIVLKSQNLPVSYSLNVVFLDPKQGVEYKTAQLINYVIAGGSANGFYISNNSITTVAHSDHYTTTTIPFVLARGFKPDTVSAITNIPIEAISTVCNSYVQGGLCNATVTTKFLSQDYSPFVTIQGTSSEGTKISMALQLNVISDLVGNLKTTPVVTITANNPQGADAILFNSGIANATISGITSSSGSIKAANLTCPTLESKAACMVHISSESMLYNTTATMTVNYNDGSNTGSTTFLVNYVAESNGVTPGFTVNNPSLNAFNYVVVKPSQPYGPMVFTITNSGNVPLNNLNFTNLANQDGAITQESSINQCQSGGSLQVNESCSIAYLYNPQTVESKILNFMITGSYTTSTGGESQVSGSPISIPVNAVQSLAVITMAVSPSSITLRADGESQAGFSITATNNGAIPATDVNFKSIIIPGIVKSVNDNPVGCSSSNSLAAGESCTVNYQFGPLTTDIGGTYAESVTYLPSPVSSLTSVSGNIQLSASTAALIFAESAAAINAESGSGTGNSPWIFANTGPNALQISITYANIGTSDATNFNVNSNVPMGFLVDASSTCPTGTVVRTLAKGDTCTVILDALNDTQPWNYQNFSGPLNLPVPGVSYSDNNTGVNQITNLSVNGIGQKIYTYAQPFINIGFLKGTNNGLVPKNGMMYYSYTIPVENSGPATLNTFNFVALPNSILPDDLKCPGNGGGSPVAPGADCTMTLLISAGGFTNYYLPYTYSGSGSSYTLSGTYLLQLNN